MVCDTATQLCHISFVVVAESSHPQCVREVMWLVSVKLYLQKQVVGRIWPVGAAICPLFQVKGSLYLRGKSTLRPGWRRKDIYSTDC